ncbi:hypothetical protein ECEC1850_3022, partial [Escherichia coli EC1850]
KM